jgi:hypothetical protein
MVRPGTVSRLPVTQALYRALQTAKDTASAADLLMLEAWEINRSMHLGIMLRIRQIRRSSAGLASEIATELADRRKETRPQVA